MCIWINNETGDFSPSTVKRLCWSYTISAGGGIASELIASLREEEVKGKWIENVMPFVDVDI